MQFPFCPSDVFSSSIELFQMRIDISFNEIKIFTFEVHCFGIHLFGGMWMILRIEWSLADNKHGIPDYMCSPFMGVLFCLKWFGQIVQVPIQLVQDGLTLGIHLPQRPEYRIIILNQLVSCLKSDEQRLSLPPETSSLSVG